MGRFLSGALRHPSGATTSWIDRKPSIAPNGRHRNTPRRSSCYLTTIVPLMCGWIEQKYLYVPGLSKVNENLSSVSSAADLKVAPASALVTVCGSSSLLVQVTLVPGATARIAGEKAKMLIVHAFGSR